MAIAGWCLYGCIGGRLVTEEHKHKVFELTKQFMDALSEFGCDSSIKIDSTLKLIEIYPNPNGPRIYNVTLKFDVVDD